jgi:hypothetical protein
VQHFKVIVTVLVLAAWSACSARCAVESLTGATALPCCDEGGGQSDQAPAVPGHCVCTTIQSGIYVSQDSALSIPLPLDGVCLFVVATQLGGPLTGPGSVELTPSPPGPLVPWQFFLRAALLARAPSLAS